MIQRVPSVQCLFFCLTKRGKYSRPGQTAVRAQIHKRITVFCADCVKRMAVPASVTTKDTSGKYVMNTKMSTPHSDVLTAQGVSWATRTSISLATVISLHRSCLF
jgi:hypothetical protein